MKQFFLLCLIIGLANGHWLKRDCRANWRWSSYISQLCPSAAVDDSVQTYRITESPTVMKTKPTFLFIQQKPISPYRRYDIIRETAFNNPKQDFYLIIDLGFIPTITTGAWEYALRKVRDVPNIKLIGTIPGTSVRFTSDYVQGYMKGWKFHGVYFYKPDYQHYNLYKDMKQLCNCTVIMDFVRAVFHGEVDNNPPETPHFWYDIADYSVQFYGNKTKFMDTPPIEFKYNTRMVAETDSDNYEDMYQLLYIKKYDGIIFRGKSSYNIGLMAYYNYQTVNGRECMWYNKATRPCIRPKDLLTELTLLGGDEFSQSYPEPPYMSYHSTGFTVTIPKSSDFNDNPDAKRRRRRAFLRNILDNYNYDQIFVDDTFVYIPSGLDNAGNYKIYKVRWTEEELLSLTVVDMKYEDHPLIIPMFPNEVIGVSTDRGVVNVKITQNGAELDFKDMHSTKWVGTKHLLENSEELKFNKDGKSYRMRIDTGIIIVNNTEGFPGNPTCLATPYTQQVTFNKDTAQQFWGHYTIRGPWVMEDWHYHMFCCLRTNYFHDRSSYPAELTNLKLQVLNIHNMSAALKHICEERSVFEIAYDKRGKPCEYCMRAREIRARYNNSDRWHDHIIVQFDKPIRVKGTYTFYTNHTYENATHYVNNSFVRNNFELWIPLKKYQCNQEVVVDMEDVRIDSWFWDDVTFTGTVDNLVYRMPPCVTPLQHYENHPTSVHRDDDSDYIAIIVGIVILILLLGFCLTSNPHQVDYQPQSYGPMLFATARKKRVLEE